MVIDQSLIGRTSSPEIHEVREEEVRRFMGATEDPALQSGAPLTYAPPTFPTTFRSSRHSIPGLELDGSKMQLLHGEQQFSYTRPLRIGEQVSCVTRVADVRQRSGRSGEMTFVILEMEGMDSQQQPIFSARSTLIVRQK